MNGSDAVGLVGEMLSIIGLVCGLPLLLYGSLRLSLDGPRIPIEIVIIHGQDSTRARWFAEGDFHERTLRPWEREHVHGQEVRMAFISSRDPAHMRLEYRSTLTTVCLTLGAVLVGVGILGLAASIIPQMIG
ncbi:hypothetical protein LG284_08480 [Citricoccus nitrophenolicus]